MVGLSAEIYICKYLTKETCGRYCIPLSIEHYKETLLSFSTPPPFTSENKTVNYYLNKVPQLIKMGFPTKKSDVNYSLCVCHKKINIGKIFKSL
jgi:transcription initiation factor TFIIH subunit 2